MGLEQSRVIKSAKKINTVEEGLLQLDLFSEFFCNRNNY